MGTTSPNHGDNVFYGCASLYRVEVTDAFGEMYFCGKETTKYVATESDSGGNASAEDNGWFVNNVAWIASTFTILVTAIGLLLKYDELKKLMQKLPCFASHEEADNSTDVLSNVQTDTIKQALI